LAFYWWRLTPRIAATGQTPSQRRDPGRNAVAAPLESLLHSTHAYKKKNSPHPYFCSPLSSQHVRQVSDAGTISMLSQTGEYLVNKGGLTKVTSPSVMQSPASVDGRPSSATSSQAGRLFLSLTEQCSGHFLQRLPSSGQLRTSLDLFALFFFNCMHWFTEPLAH
jgi:hypothetical protein